MKSLRRVLYASDFSKASGRAFDTALAMAKAKGGRLTILHVIVPLVPLVPDPYVDLSTLERLDAQARKWGAKRLKALAEKARRAGVSGSTLLREGDPAEQIIRAARSTKADVIVVGTHGRRGLARLFIGSVAARVVATSRCPVVTVRGKS